MFNARNMCVRARVSTVLKCLQVKFLTSNLNSPIQSFRHLYPIHIFSTSLSNTHLFDIFIQYTSFRHLYPIHIFSTSLSNTHLFDIFIQYTASRHLYPIHIFSTSLSNTQLLDVLLHVPVNDTNLQKMRRLTNQLFFVNFANDIKMEFTVSVKKNKLISNLKIYYM